MKKTLKKTLLILLAVITMTVIFCFGAGAATEGYYTYEVSDGEATITNVDESISGEVVIPSTLGGYPVTIIDSQAFYRCNSLTNVTIPGSVKTIGDYAFAYSTLTDINIGNGVTSIGVGAFINEVYDSENKGYDKEIFVPASVVDIGEKAFGYFWWGGPDAHGWFGNITIEAESGTTAEKYAKDNGLTFVEYNPHTHSYTAKTTKSATCTATGVKTYTCSCGDKYTKSIAKLGHKYSSSFTVDKKATCTVAGSKSKHCTRSGCSAKTSVTAIAKLAHTYSEYVYNNDSTYVAEGTKTAKCKSCSAVNTVTAEGTKLTLATTSKVSSTKTTTSATLKWNAVEGATGYRVFQKVDGKWKKLTDTTKLTYSVKSLKAGTKYNFAVRAYVLDGDTKVMAPKYKSFSVTTTKASTKPAQVKNVKATPTATTVKLTWSKVSGVKGYYVFSYNSKTKKYTSLGKTTGTSYTVKKLKANTAYQYAVQAYKVSDGKNVYGKVSSVVKVTTKLATPTLKVTSTKGKANLSWNNIAGESGYAIYMATAKNGKYTHLSNYKANSTKATKSKLKSGKTYYFKIRAYKTVSGKKTYSAYSAVKSVKVK